MASNHKYSLYLNALINVLEELKKDTLNKHYIKQNVLYSVKLISLTREPKGYDEIRNMFEFISATNTFISYLTPREFMNLFPVSKFYDGDRYGMKDYHYTMDYINSMNKDEPIGEKALEFLVEYTNRDIHIFNMKSVMCLSRLRQYDGHLGLMEEFLAANGHDTTNTFKNDKGKAMYVRNGKPTLVKEFKTNRLELIK